jgi:hypothetical protein
MTFWAMLVDLYLQMSQFARQAHYKLLSYYCGFLQSYCVVHYTGYENASHRYGN